MSDMRFNQTFYTLMWPMKPVARPRRRCPSSPLARQPRDPCPRGWGRGVARMTGSASVCTPRRGGGAGPSQIARLKDRITSQSCQSGRPQSRPPGRAPRRAGIRRRAPGNRLAGPRGPEGYSLGFRRVGPRGPGGTLLRSPWLVHVDWVRTAPFRPGLPSSAPVGPRPVPPARRRAAPIRGRRTRPAEATRTAR